MHRELLRRPERRRNRLDETSLSRTAAFPLVLAMLPGFSREVSETEDTDTDAYAYQVPAAMSHSCVELSKVSMLTFAPFGIKQNAWTCLLDELSSIFCTLHNRCIIGVDNNPHDAAAGVSQRNSTTRGHEVVY